ncbi:peptidase S41 [Thermoclostridium stercorarium subsp. thermolacticum DSM 2910]|uniref:Peptidase S41 n=3 Tax=Thermoclostridium stercorarium TaxID=1510 RepID=A0A1B1YPF0_THEST|nr:stalk domain-containing protein [Thermoclostridium stercorarium]ANX00008.1 peptidase S41 [Thermoclostridium stercorarium subsp. thermolacticum DSM 2910]ANX02653.1 peptidase S41 [Thermoclostridium stercorarium subsp. leptospartum DSM 9219]UZQ86818.1 DUF5050 domain-containing protein [Thermoclostridium stercorarium]
MLKNAVKKFIGILLIFLVIIAFPFHVTAQKSTEGPEIRVYVNDTEVAVDVPPFFVKSFTLVPVRAVFEALGAKVQWDDSAKTVVITRGNEVRVQPGNRIAMVNNVPYIMEVPAVGVNGRVMVPVRFVSEALGARVDWVNETKTVFIYDLKEQKEQGNVQNGGRFASDGDYYYHVLSDGVLIKENITTKQKEKISDNITGDLYIINDWLYCIGREKGVTRVIRMKKDGSEKQVIVNKPVKSIQVVNGWIYYSEADNETILYRTRTDGSATMKIVENGDFSPKNWLVHNGWIYYFDNRNGTVCRVRIDGSDKRSLTSKLSGNYNDGKIYGLKLTDGEFLYFVIYKEITDINKGKYASGLYRVPVSGGRITRITDKIPLAINMEGEGLYLAVENRENSYSLIRCKKDGSEVLTINEYKKGDIPQSIYLDNKLILYTVIRGEGKKEELLFSMGQNGNNIQQYNWIYGRDYHKAKKILSDAFSAHKSLNVLHTVQTSSVDKNTGMPSVIYETTINRSRALFHKKISVENMSFFEIWLDGENLYSKRDDEVHWDIAKISKSEAAEMKKSVFDYVRPTDELCNNLNVHETENSYILKGSGNFNSFVSEIFPLLGLDKGINIHIAELELKIDKKKKYIEEFDIMLKYDTGIEEKGEIKELVNKYHFINSQFNTAFLTLPYTVSQSIKAKESAEKSITEGLKKFEQGKYEEAVKLFDTAIGMYNKLFTAYLYKGNSLYNLGRYQEAILAYTRYNEVNPSDKEVFALMGMCYFKTGDFSKAEELGKETLKYTQSVKAYNLLGSIASAREEYKTAVDYFNRAVSLDSLDYTSNMNLISVLYSMGDYNKCIDAVNNSLKYFPKNRELLYVKAQCLADLGKHDRAIEVYEDILAGNPNDFVTMTYMAREYEKLQNYQKAKEYAEMAKAIYPDYSLLKYLSERLNYDLSTTAGEKLANFIKENYLYYKETENVNREMKSVIEKGDLFTVEDVRKLLSTVRSQDDSLTRLISGYEYDFYFNNGSVNQIETRQEEKYVYVRLKNLYPGISAQFIEFIQSVENPGEKILIVDLRDNSTGLTYEANKILDALLGECTPGYVIDRNGFVNIYSSGKWHTSFKKTGILVNEKTAGAAEFFTLGLKTFGNDVSVIGTKTAGKGTGQVIYTDRGRKFAVFLVNHYWNVMQINIEGTGIKADITVDQNDKDYSNAVKKFIEGK